MAAATDENVQAQALFSLCTDFFVLGLQIAGGMVELPTCESLKRRVLLLFETMKSRAHEAAVVPSDVEDASYALAAYLDEMIQYSNWPGKQEWAARPLQAMMFGESQAGARFFDRLQEVRRRSPPATQIYYACLSLGFMGELRIGGETQLAQLIDDLRRELFHGSARALSVHGMRPDARGLGGRTLPLLPVAAVCLLLSVAVIAVLYMLLSSTTTEAADILQRMGRG